MNPPKQKPPMSKPKILKKSIRSIGGVKNKVDKVTYTINKANKANNTLQKQIPDNQRVDKPETYAADNVTEKGEYTARKVGGKTAEITKKTANKGYEKIREHHNVKQR